MTPAGPSDLQNNFKHSLPRPYGRGYYMTALRAYPEPFVTSLSNRKRRQAAALQIAFQNPARVGAA